MRKVKRYECLGGPLDGRKVPARGQVIFVDDFDEQRHFYRLCTCSMEDSDVVGLKFATYYHYLGDRLHNAEPVLIPHRRKFK
jgi:hypothetical protein